ncbi:MAG: hypothetical protein WCJ30_05425 [Deltaproteobacteria bacterium]
MSPRARVGALAFALLFAACGGASTSGNGTATTTTAAATGSESSVSPTSDAPGGRRSGLGVHLQGIHASGSLPSDADPAVDHLEVTFEMVLNHMGAEPLTGLSITRARLVHDDGREVVFGVSSDAWDGRLEPGQQRVLAFHKTPDSASPIARQGLCGQHMRLEVTLDLAGRQTTAQTRRVQVDCPQMHPR